MKDLVGFDKQTERLNKLNRRKLGELLLESWGRNEKTPPLHFKETASEISRFHCFSDVQCTFIK